MPDQTNGDLQVTVPAGRIDLGVGQPDPSLLPLGLVREAAARRLAQPDPSLLAYGAEQGGKGLRQALAAFLTRASRTAVASEHLFITGGASHGLDLLAGMLTQPGDTVLVEVPTYFCALRILRERGLTLVGVPTDHDGLRIDLLPDIIDRHRPRFLYTVPAFHNPLGVSLPAERRRQLVELARKHDFVIVADEVYELLSFGPPPFAMGGYDPGLEWVVTLGAFTKILAPGLRLGWIETNPSRSAALAGSGVRFSAGGVNPFTGELVRTLLEDGLQDAHLAALRQTLRSRAAALAGALRSHLPDAVEFAEATGGYFLWLRLPPGIDAEGLLPAAHEAGVGFRSGRLFALDGSQDNCLRVGFSYYPEPELIAGGIRLASVIRNALD